MRRVLGLDGEDHMPLDADPLPEATIAQLRAWIDQGAADARRAGKLHSSADHGRNANRRRSGTLGVHQANAPRAATGCANGMAAQRDRSLRAGAPREREAAAVAGGIEIDAAPARDARPHRPAADAGRGRRVPRRHRARRLRARRRPPARLAALRRALGPPVARPRALRRHQRLREGQPPRASGSTATGSSTRSTATCRSTSSPIEQIAGDLLPNATLEQQIATGFHRNAMTNEEGGVDPDESMYEVLVDRVNTTATVWLGTTLGCAQCHNHKYDPFSQKDYFRLLAFFANADYESRTFGDGTRFSEPARPGDARAGASAPAAPGRHRPPRAGTEGRHAGDTRAQEPGNSRCALPSASGRRSSLRTRPPPTAWR